LAVKHIAGTAENLSDAKLRDPDTFDGAPMPATTMTRPRKPVFVFNGQLSKFTSLALGCLVWICFIGLWQAAISIYGASSIILPEPSAVLSALYYLFTQQNFASDVGISVYRIMLSFLAASAVAVPLGILMGAFKPFEAFFNPLVSAWRYLPATSFVPLLLMWFGVGDFQKIGLLFLGVVWFLITMVMDYTKAVSRDLIETSLTLGGTRLQVLWTVILPAALPNIWTAMRQMLAASWTYLVIAEIVAATDGIGAMMTRASRFVHTDQVMAGIVTIGVLGLISDYAFRFLHGVLFPYADTSTK
jgi:NitT/TauT family transport system permease protein